MDYSRAPTTTSTATTARHLGLLLLRLTAGGSLLCWYSGRQALLGWSHLWQKTPWELPGQLTTLGFPLALPLAVFLVILTFAGALFMILGLLTRLSAILIAVVAAVTAILFTAYPVVEERALLYTGLCLAISLCGPGLIALDGALKARAKRRP